LNGLARDVQRQLKEKCMQLQVTRAQILKMLLAVFFRGVNGDFQLIERLLDLVAIEK
jgi:chemotaxis regulatin CheY-phosphate phosphatase CheZ